MRERTITLDVEEILNDYSEEVRHVVDEAVNDVAKECAQRLRDTSPKKTGEYASGWTIRKERGNKGLAKLTVFNKKAPGLTHLLEFGHVIRNGKGTYGRAPAYPHIAPVEEWANSELPDRIKRRLE